MGLTEIRIDDETWRAASPDRHREWRQVMSELVEEPPLRDDPRPLRLRITVRPEAAVLEVETLSDSPPSSVAKVELPFVNLAPRFREYFDICRQLGRLGESSPRFEALDIAKRLAHDEAAEMLQALTTPLAAGHATCRRLFTLLVVLYFDTTRLNLPHH